MELTWDDLLIQNVSEQDAAAWIAEWAPLVSGKFHPIFLSKFGDWFLRRPDGTTELLDVLEGKLTKIANTPDEFQSMVNDVAWQEEKLLSRFIYQLHEEGKIPDAGQCYGFAPHPSFTGSINPDHVVLLDIVVWQSICSQAFFPREAS